MNKVKFKLPIQTAQQKVSSAIFVSVYGSAFAGIRTKAQLMQPHDEFTDAQADKEAASFLADVHTALLEALPPERLERMLKDQDERLSFAL